ncbi:MAG: type II toxin-antitoxin system PemK/MazF family toxin [Tunicatimonas sp.]
MSVVKEGDIILASLPQANGQVKLRPVLVLRQVPPFRDFLLCGISSQLRHAVPGLDMIIDNSHSDFSRSGLTIPSLIRTAFLTIKPSDTIAGAIGSVSRDTYRQLLSNLANYLLQADNAEEI